MIPDPSQGLDSVRPPIGMDMKRFESRNQLYNNLISQSAFGEFGSDYQKESLRRSMEQAYILLNSPESKAFNLSTEPKEIYDIYNTGRFGLGCLLHVDLLKKELDSLVLRLNMNRFLVGIPTKMVTRD